MHSASSERRSKGAHILIYPSPLLGPGRLGKIGRSLQTAGLFDETIVVGIRSGDVPAVQALDPMVRIERVRGASIGEFLGGLRIMALWPFRVYRRYRRENLTAVAAQNVYVLPLAYHLARKSGAVLAYNAHELETETIGAGWLKKKIAKLIERRYIRRVDVVSVVNESIADWYAEAYPGLTPVVLTNTPIDDGTSVDLRRQLNIPDDDLLYIHVGFLTAGRSIPLLLREFASRPHLHLAFLGDGAMRPLVEKAMRSAPNIHLVPTVVPDGVVSVVRGADVGLCVIEYVSLSDKLSTPNKLMEAWVAGIPPLSSDLIEARRLLGPVLSQTWVLENPEQELGAALDRIGTPEIAEFQKYWHPIPTWDDQAVDLVRAYREALARRDSVPRDQLS
jgi:glycosyltransferase involved in cell wall biosynthesis